MLRKPKIIQMHPLLKTLCQRKYYSKSCPILRDEESWRLEDLAHKEQVSGAMPLFFLEQRCFNSRHQTTSGFSESEYPQIVHLFSRIADHCRSTLLNLSLSLLGLLLHPATIVLIPFIQVNLSMNGRASYGTWGGYFMPHSSSRIFSFRMGSSIFLNLAIQRIVSASCGFIAYLGKCCRSIYCFVQSFPLSDCKRLLSHQWTFKAFYNYFGYLYSFLSLETALTGSILVKDLPLYSLPIIQPVQKNIHITDEEYGQFFSFLKRREDLATYFSCYYIVFNPWCANKLVDYGEERYDNETII